MSDVTARVTIGVPVYNGGTMFVGMLESLLHQTYPCFEVIVCDNASTDDTAKIAQEFAARDGRIRYFRNDSNIGASPNYNRTFELAGETPYFKWAPHDDLYAPTYLERCVELLDRDPTAVLAHTIVDLVDETGQGRLLEHASYGRGVLDSYVDANGRHGWTMGPLGLAEGADPAQRLDEFLNRMIACFPIFGVIRTEALRRSSLHQNYYGCDRAMLAEFLLMGRFRQVQERLYTNRYHKTASRELSGQEKMAWIDSKGGSSRPLLRQKLDILRAPLKLGLSPGDSARCIAVALRHFARREAGRILKPALSALRPRRADAESAH